MDWEKELTDEQLLQLTTAELRRVVVLWRRKNSHINNISNSTKSQLIPLIKAQYVLASLVPTFEMGEIRKSKLQRDLLITSKEVVHGDLVMKIPVPPPAKKYDYFKPLRKRKEVHDRTHEVVESDETQQSCDVPEFHGSADKHVITKVEAGTSDSSKT